MGRAPIRMQITAISPINAAAAAATHSLCSTTKAAFFSLGRRAYIAREKQRPETTCCSPRRTRLGSAPRPAHQTQHAHSARPFQCKCRLTMRYDACLCFLTTIGTSKSPRIFHLNRNSTRILHCYQNVLEK
jgi:hypothetical protein